VCSSDLLFSFFIYAPVLLLIFHLGQIGRWILGSAIPALLQAPASRFVGPIFIWALVAFRREDWSEYNLGSASMSDARKSL